MKILVTGFNAFGKVKVNPSELIVRHLPSRRQGKKARAGSQLVAELLPTEYVAATRRVRQLIRREQPDAILCLGVAERRERISLERVALNLDDEPLADNAGLVRRGQPIVRGGPPLYWSALPLEAMLRALTRRRIPAQISNHAGTYLCNHIFYVARHYVTRHNKARRRMPCGFVHLPKLLPPGSKSKRGMTLAMMLRAIDCCIEIVKNRLA